MKDQYGRTINYMRISVTDKCNNRCKYCMPPEGVEDLGHNTILKYEEIERIVKAAASLGITKYRLTGGEPLVRKGIVSLVEKMAKIPGVEEIGMTTNGILLGKYAQELKKVGLNRVNISLDSLRHSRYKEITRGGDLDEVIAGINAAEKAGLTPIKINVVAMKGFNDDELMDFVQLTFQHDYEVRFIELMPIGTALDDCEYGYISCEEIKAKLPGIKPLEEGNGVAELFKYRHAIGKIGFITPISSCFCKECNKLRLTSDGKIKTCLHSEQEIDLREALDQNTEEALVGIIKNAINSKEERHHLEEGKAPIARDMNRIGG